MIVASFGYQGNDPDVAKYAREKLKGWIAFDSVYIWGDEFIGYTNPPNEIGEEIVIHNFSEYRVCFRG